MSARASRQHAQNSSGAVSLEDLATSPKTHIQERTHARTQTSTGPKATVPMSVRLSESVWLELDALYKRTGVKKQTLIEHAITDMLANHRSKV